MGASLAFWEAVVEDNTGFLRGIIDLLDSNNVRYCVIGGVGVNAYAEPIVTQDLDIVIAIEDLPRTRALIEQKYRIHEFPYSWNVHDPAGSKLQVQLQVRPEMQPWLEHAERRFVMDLLVPVASPEDLFEAKLAAALEPKRRQSKRLKDYADLRRLIDSFPNLRPRLPQTLVPIVMADEQE